MTTEIELFDRGGHRNILLPEVGQEGDLSVQANQHLIIHGPCAMILDPGGHKVYSKVLKETTSRLADAKLTHIFLSHQDPDIVAAVNGWLMTTDAIAMASELWLRFIPHFGVDKFVASRLTGIPDEGQILDLGGADLFILPAHFMHSCGNFQVYDPTSKILYTGDLGASVGMDYREVTDFDAHLPFMKGFHQRYITSNQVLRLWAEMVRGLDIECIAPQHGALFRGKAMVERFIDWCANLQCGIDLMGEAFKVPTQRREAA
ncbi:MAG: FprA family A-type flavoprotein [Planctomycetes bacterium]|nr:FprA family A-type flavoprotein [Planctomycetota bacterium]